MSIDDQNVAVNWNWLVLRFLTDELPDPFGSTKTETRKQEKPKETPLLYLFVRNCISIVNFPKESRD